MKRFWVDNTRMATLHRNPFLAILLVCFLLPGGAAVASHKKKPTPPGQFSYYLLVLSYAPDFCDQPQGVKDPRECGPGRRVGFIVHGLWPQGESSRGPENCGSAGTLSQAIIDATLKYVPTEALIQHEWTAHGSCSGLNADDYFSALRKARESVTVPADLDQPSQALQLSPAEVEAKLAAANPSFPPAAFRTSCYKDNELQEVRICLNKDLSARACGASAGECSAASLNLLPVR